MLSSTTPNSDPTSIRVPSELSDDPIRQRGNSHHPMRSEGTLLKYSQMQRGANPGDSKNPFTVFDHGDPTIKVQGMTGHLFNPDRLRFRRVVSFVFLASLSACRFQQPSNFGPTTRAVLWSRRSTRESRKVFGSAIIGESSGCAKVVSQLVRLVEKTAHSMFSRVRTSTFKLLFAIVWLDETLAIARMPTSM